MPPDRHPGKDRVLDSRDERTQPTNGELREFCFTIEYRTATDPISEVFVDAPDLVARSLDSCVTGDRVWRLERITGPEAALDELQARRFDDDVCGETITDHRCRAGRFHDVLERRKYSRVLFAYLDGIHGCESVHTLAARLLGPGVVFQTRRSGREHRWRLLVRSDENVGRFFETLSARLREGLSVRFDHVGTADGWYIDSLSTVSMPDEQREALRAAVDRGFYERPRNVSIDELAAELDVPSSTVSYRLRQAEAELVRAYLGDRYRPSGAN